MLQLMYADIYQDAKGTRQVVRAPTESTVYSSVRSYWLQRHQNGDDELRTLLISFFLILDLDAFFSKVIFKQKIFIKKISIRYSNAYN